MRYKKIFITHSARRAPITQEMLARYACVRPRIIPDDTDISTLTENLDPREVLLLCHSKGDVVKGCPGTDPAYLCCRYQVINQTLHCPLSCSYCILQYYLNQPATVIYTNIPAILSELSAKLKAQPARFFRIGTGELADSLALDGSVSFARQAIEYFAKIPNALLELKTKTSRIQSLLGLKHGGRTVLAWSLNPERIIRGEEHKSASLANRLKAAVRAQADGYLTAFHLDPILDVPDWESQYSELIDKLYATVDTRRVAWISMGSLRFPPAMKARMIERYPNSTLLFGELVLGEDKKMRYARPVRLPLYRHVYRQLTSCHAPPFIYFCMENPAVWREIMGFAPDNNAHLDFLFADSIHKRFPDLLADPPQRQEYDRGWDLHQE